jgi:hypothetical protein
MTINTEVGYAWAKITAAYDLLASLTIPTNQRLAGAAHVLRLAVQHGLLPTTRARELHERALLSFQGAAGDWESVAAALDPAELTEIGHAIRDLCGEVTAVYYGAKPPDARWAL